MGINIAKVRRRINQIFPKNVLNVSSHILNLPKGIKHGKAYEIYVLAEIIEKLVNQEKIKVTFNGSTKLYFKAKGGPINKKYPYFSLHRNGIHIGDLYTDVEFMTLSAIYSNPSQSIIPKNGEKHELDILITIPNCNSYPHFNEILLGVECKDTTYGKNLLRESLGVRRELSCFQPNQSISSFQSYPIQNSIPASVLLVYSTDPTLSKYKPTGDIFDIYFETLT